MPAEAKIDIVLRDGTTDRQPRPSPPAPAGGEQPAARDRLRPGANPDRPWETPHAPITRVDGKATKIDGRSRGTQDEAAESERTLPRPAARPVQTTEAFDPAAEARRILQGEERRQAIQAELAKLRGPADPGEEARRQAEARRHGEEVALHRRAILQGTDVETLRSRERTQAIGTGLAGAARSAISGDVGGAASRLAELVPATSAAGKALAGMAVPVGVAAAALGVFALATRQAGNALSERADQLAPYSGPLSVAQANAEIRQVLNDIRRAQDAGPALAGYVEAKSHREEAWRDLTLTIEKKLTPFMTKLEYGTAAILRWLDSQAKKEQRVQDIHPLFQHLLGDTGGIGRALEDIKRMLEEEFIPEIDELKIDNKAIMERSNKLLEDIKEQAKRPRAMGVPRVL